MLMQYENDMSQQGVSKRRRTTAVMALKAGPDGLLNEESDVETAFKKNVVMTSLLVTSRAEELAMDRDSLIKDLRMDLRETNKEIKKLTDELFKLKGKHGEVLTKYEGAGDEIRSIFRTKADLESKAKQSEKRADRSDAETSRLQEQFEKISLKIDDAENAQKAYEEDAEKGGKTILNECDKLRIEIEKLESDAHNLRKQADAHSKEADEMRIKYQQSSTEAAEICRDLESLKEIGKDLESKLTDEPMRLRVMAKDTEFSTNENLIRQMNVRIANLEDYLQRLESERQKKAAIYAARGTTGVTSTRRTRSPASVLRGCSPASTPNNHSHSNSGGHPLQHSQKV
ncbi:hypothetical protein V1511DRAFT_493853 [Dipodascopsis uninucleata]